MSSSDKGKKQDANSEATAIWQGFMDRKAAQVIYPVPDKLAGKQTFVVAPAEKPDFWMGGFGAQKSARLFCKQNGLHFTEHRYKPSAI